MELAMLLLPLAVFAIAALYASVGHGGASGYIAVLSLTMLSPAEISTTALILNVLVAGIAVLSFARAGHLSWRLTWPFLIGSVPAALVGGSVRINDHTYFVLVAFVLVFAAVRMVIPALTAAKDRPVRTVRTSTALPAGAAIGLLSGIVGVGGGIFLSPLMMLKNWAAPKQIAASAACFVAINSLAGLAGRAFTQTLAAGEIGYLPLVALAGGWLGSHIGATRFPAVAVRSALAAILIIAAAKLFITSGI